MNTEVSVQPQIKKTLLGWEIAFPIINVKAIVKNLELKQNALKGFMKLTRGDQIIYQGAFNFYSQRAGGDILKELSHFPDLVEIIEPKNFIEQLRRVVIAEFRKGSPVEPFTIEDIQIKHLVHPFIYEDSPNVIFAPGGTGKTTMALLLSLAVITDDYEFLLPATRTGSVLFLDYENNRRFVFNMLKQLTDKVELLQKHFFYRKCTLPLREDLEHLKEIIDDKKPALVIIDSLGYATGGEMVDAASINSFFLAIRELHTTTLILTHVAKGDIESPFGSVYITNYARNVWKLNQYPRDKHSYLLSVLHKKCNLAPLENPITYLITIGDRIQVELSDTPAEVLAGVNLKQSILNVLASGEKMTTQDIADLLGKKHDPVKVTLYRLLKEKKISKIDKYWFKGSE